MERKTLESANAPASLPEKPQTLPEGLQPFATVQAHEQTAIAAEPRQAEPLARVEMTDGLFEAICEDIANGKTLLQICRAPGMPHASTVRRFVQRGSKEIRAKYADARALGIETLADEIVEIADDSSGDEKEIETQNGGSYTVLNKEFAERSKIRIDARKWMLSKLAAHTYGDKIEQTVNSTVTQFTIKVGDGSVQERAQKNVSEERERVTFNLPPERPKTADEIIEENL